MQNTEKKAEDEKAFGERSPQVYKPRSEPRDTGKGGDRENTTRSGKDE